MKLYGISGLGADERVFQFLDLTCTLEPVHWITPYPGESLEEYAERLAEQIDTREEFGLIGVSFGGLVAIELSKKLSPEFIILISSVSTRFELRRLYLFIGYFRMIRYLPLFIFKIPRILAGYLFGTRETKLLMDIINDTDIRFVRWALSKFTEWKNTARLPDCYKINGDKDKLIPFVKGSCEEEIVIKGGGHFMIVDRAKQLSKEINRIIAKYI